VTLNSCSNIILPTAFFGSIKYFAHIAQSDGISIEIFESFPKQTIRNRCEVLTSNGIARLTVPVVKCRKKQLTKEIKISYAENWQYNHLKTLKTAYNKSPFFEYYIDELIVFFEKKYDYLIDYNFDITNKILKILQLNQTINFTKDYIHNYPLEIKDFRVFTNELNIENPVYIQVFSNEFKQNLSVLDLIFNVGNEALNHIKKYKS